MTEFKLELLHFRLGFCILIMHNYTSIIEYARCHDYTQSQDRGTVDAQRQETARRMN